MTDTVIKRPGSPRKVKDQDNPRRIDCSPIPLAYVTLLRELGRQVTGKPNVTAGLRYLCQLYLEHTQSKERD